MRMCQNGMRHAQMSFDGSSKQENHVTHRAVFVHRSRIGCSTGCVDPESESKGQHPPFHADVLWLSAGVSASVEPSVWPHWIEATDTAGNSSILWLLYQWHSMGFCPLLGLRRVVEASLGGFLGRLLWEASLGGFLRATREVSLV